MSRPRKGEKGSEEATKKWRATMLKRYGSEKALHEQMVKLGAKGGKVSTPTGGFGSDKVGRDGLTGRERAALVGAIGGHRSSREGVKTGEGKNPKKKKTEQTANKEEKTGLIKKIFGGR